MDDKDFRALSGSREPEQLAGPALSGFDPAQVVCPNCGTELWGEFEAQLPEATDLTLVIQVAEGQMIQAKTLSGVVKEFDAMQRAIGKELGAKTTTLIKSLTTSDAGAISITFRICNSGGVERRDSGRPPQGGDGTAAGEAGQSGGSASERIAHSTEQSNGQ